jgi:acetyltransferase-like isoleucine patch superfamily enzyme
MKRLGGFSGISSGLNAAYSKWVSSTYGFESIGKNLSIHYTSDLSRHTAHRMRIGDDVRIDKGAWLYVVPPEGEYQEHEPALIIGDRTLIARHSQIGARKRVHIDSDVTLSVSVLIIDHLHAYEEITLPINQQGLTDGGSIHIKQGCWIGHGAAIICDKGELVLGRNCVVAANAVVTKSFPSYSVIAGNPARIVRQYDFEKSEWTLGATRTGVAEEERVVNANSKPIDLKKKSQDDSLKESSGRCAE